MSAFGLIVRRELRLALKQGADATLAVMFFVLAVVLFTLGVGPEPNTLALVSPGVLWVTALLAAVLSLERLFLADYEDGSLDLLALAPLPLEAVVLAKCLAHWLVTGLPFMLAAPLLGLLLNLPTGGYGVLIAALALGTPSLSLVGAIGAALSLGARRGGVLIPLLVLPPYVPVLIFAVSAVDSAVQGLSAGPALLILAALLVVALPACPWAAAAALRQALD